MPRKGKGGKVVLLHIGKKAPKGWREVSAMHLGKGIYAIRCEKEVSQNE